MIFCARATRGRGLPSLDARTLGTRQAAASILEKKDERSTWGTVSHKHGSDDDENIECPCFFILGYSAVAAECSARPD